MPTHSYSLSTPLRFVVGIGPVRAQALAEQELYTVGDLLVLVPLRYEDRSHITTITDAPIGQLITLQAKVVKVKESFGRVRYTKATLRDATGTVTALWFNNRFVAKNLKPDHEYVFSGKINDKRTVTQPTIESAYLAPSEHIHTSRLVPMYSGTLPFPTSQWRRLLKEITDHLEDAPDALYDVWQEYSTNALSRKKAFQELHFPSQPTEVAVARERLALEELILLIKHSQQLQKKWKNLPHAATISSQPKKVLQSLSAQLPFHLTSAQQRSVTEILSDMHKVQPMNRLLMGDVGSGKTIVAGIVASECIKAGYNVTLIAPTRILAEQHLQSLKKNLPDLPTALVVGGGKNSNFISQKKPTLYVGTHAVLNILTDVQPALVIYDEQHRFGVTHRSKALTLTKTPHVLTMTATPIPRTLLLTIFAHLHVSVLDELPANRLPTQTWVLPEEKRSGLFTWLQDQVKNQAQKTHFQTLIVCPFIETSESPQLANVAAAIPLFTALHAKFGKKLHISLLHGRQAKKLQSDTLRRLRDGQIDVLITTTIVEVGVDLPQASLIIIESAQRYGLASLHQLRGRVGRAGQQGYCALFYGSQKPSPRLEAFSRTLNGQELAELDLQQRGAGDLFGLQQSGFDQLQFASWTNLELLHVAQQICSKLPNTWQSCVKPKFSFAEDILSN